MRLFKQLPDFSAASRMRWHRVDGTKSNNTTHFRIFSCETRSINSKLRSSQLVSDSGILGGILRQAGEQFDP